MFPGAGAFAVVPAGGVPPVEAAPFPGAVLPAPPPAGGGEEGVGFGPGAAEPLLGRLVFRLPEEGVFPPPVRLAATVCITVRAAWFAIMVGRAIKPCPRGLPVWAGFSPIRQTISSIFLPTRTMAVTKISQGKIPRPLGTVLMVERSSFRKMTFISIITHILPNILHMGLGHVLRETGQAAQAILQLLPHFGLCPSEESQEGDFLSRRFIEVYLFHCPAPPFTSSRYWFRKWPKNGRETSLFAITQSSRSGISIPAIRYRSSR